MRITFVFPFSILTTSLSRIADGLLAFSQTTPISPPSLIPTLEGLPIAFIKIDHAIVFSETNAEVKDLYNTVKTRHHRLRLCQSDNLALGRFIQFARIEVKSADGSYYAASAQLAVWLSAGLEKMRLLKELATGMEDETPLLSSVGISVTGYVWNLHLAAKAADGTVVRVYISTASIIL